MAAVPLARRRRSRDVRGVGDRLVHRVSAFNTATESLNKIHDDETARRFGFSGGLVPGVDVYAYMTRPAAELWGLPWLERGTMEARFAKPVYDGRMVTVEATTCGTVAHPALSIEVRDDEGRLCAVGAAALPPGAPVPVDPGRYPVAPLPEVPPPASAEALLAADPMGSIESGFHAEHAPRYLDEVRESLPLYRRYRVAHPGWLLRNANLLLAENVSLGPWIHVGSRVRHLGLVHDGDRISTRGRPTAVFERKGHELVALDVVVVAGDDRPVMYVEHTAIFNPRPAETAAGS